MILFIITALIFSAYIMALRCRKGNISIDIFKNYYYAHRGLHDGNNKIPENSMSAFENAINHGFGVELDVHLTKDNELVVIHDSDIKRMTGEEGIIEEMTLQQIKQLHLAQTNCSIPLFCDVLKLFENKTPLIIELKTYNKNHAELTKTVTELIDKYHVTYCMESFDPFAVKWLKENRPDIIRGQLSDNFIKNPGKLRYFEAFILTHLLFNFVTLPDFIAYQHQHRGCISNRLCQLFWHPMKVSWTIKSEKDRIENEKEGCLIIFEGFLPNSDNSFL